MYELDSHAREGSLMNLLQKASKRSQIPGATENEKMKTRTIRQSATFQASPHDVYELLMDSRKHARFTGGKCSISRKVGGHYSVYDGYIVGKNIELVPDKKIVQSWKPEEDCWPDDYYSMVTFELKPVKGGTRLSFKQTGVPVDCGDRFDIGWREHYWAKMKALLSEEAPLSLKSRAL